jgi:putative acetyltransferase
MTSKTETTIDLTIRPFQPEDQEVVKDMIQSGLGEHWGFIDPTLNPDLENIAASYKDATFLVARHQDRIVGTGALVPRPDNTGEVVRMSVVKDMRQRGIGRCILKHLIERAKYLGYHWVILETTAEWGNVIAFYKDNGFEITHHMDGNIYFKIEIV